MIRWFFIVLLAVVAGAAMFLQRETTANLRSELILLREERSEIARLRAERDRLRAAQVPAAELERLRADRAALVQLRAEVEKMKEGAARAETMAANAPGSTALTLGFAVGNDGILSSEGSPLDLNSLKQRLAPLAKGAVVEIRIALDPQSPVDQVKAAVDNLIKLEKELGLKFNLRFDQRTVTAR
jgi:hypothetical protein